MDSTVTSVPLTGADARLWRQVERVERAVDSLLGATEAIVDARGGPAAPLRGALRTSSQALRPIVVLLARCCTRLISGAAEDAEREAGRSRDLVEALGGRAGRLTPPNGVHQSVLAVLGYAEATRRLLTAVNAMHVCLGHLDASDEQLRDLTLLEQEARIGAHRTQRLAREASGSLQRWRC